MKTRNKKFKLKDYSLRHLLKNIIIIAQCFAVLPVNGISKEPKHLKFKWISFKTLYTIVTIILQTIYTILVALSAEIDIENFFSIVVVIWNVRGLIGLVIFLKVGYNWPQLLQQWTEMEHIMLDYGPIPSLKFRIKLLAVIFLITGTFEHSLFIFAGTKKVLSLMTNDDNFFKVFFKTLYGEFFSFVEYAHWKAIFVEFLALMTTFLWQFCDLLIVLLSSALAERFRQINAKIIGSQALNELDWRNIRMRYNKLAVLCKTLNNAIAEMILLSFIGNVYFLSVIIFQSFTPRSSFQAFYFWYDVIFNSTHFILVYYYTAWVHEESQKPMLEIFSVPSGNMNYEVHRFLQQIVAEDVTIHGAGLFKITRSTILGVATVIITLQLIFFQFISSIPSNIT